MKYYDYSITYNKVTLNSPAYMATISYIRHEEYELKFIIKDDTKKEDCLITYNILETSFDRCVLQFQTICNILNKVDNALIKKGKDISIKELL